MPPQSNLRHFQSPRQTTQPSDINNLFVSGFPCRHTWRIISGLKLGLPIPNVRADSPLDLLAVAAFAVLHYRISTYRSVLCTRIRCPSLISLVHFILRQLLVVYIHARRLLHGSSVHQLRSPGLDHLGRSIGLAEHRINTNCRRQGHQPSFLILFISQRTGFHRSSHQYGHH